MIDEFETIERIENFIAIAQRRLDTVIREFDRHRFIHNQSNSVRNVVDSEFKIAKPIAISKVA